MAAVSRGVSEFLAEGERLQPKVQPRSLGAVRMLWVSEGGSFPILALPSQPLLAAGGRAGGDERASPCPAVGGRGREGGWVCSPPPGAGGRDAAALLSKAAQPRIRRGQRDRHQSSQLVLKSGSALALLRREGLGVGARGMRCDGFAY